MDGDLYSEARDFLSDFISIHPREIDDLVRGMNSLAQRREVSREDIANRRETLGRSQLQQLEEELRELDSQYRQATDAIARLQDRLFRKISALEEKPGPVTRALTSWVDDIMIEWEKCAWWAENPLEYKTFKTHRSASEFWKEAGLRQDVKTGIWEINEGSLARARQKDPSPGTTVKEIEELRVFYLCVILGFRGSLWDQESCLTQWVEEAAHVLACPTPMQTGKGPDGPTGKRRAIVRRRDRSRSPSLGGHRRLKRMISVGSILPAVVLLTFLVWFTASFFH